MNAIWLHIKLLAWGALYVMLLVYAGVFLFYAGLCAQCLFGHSRAWYLTQVSMGDLLACLRVSSLIAFPHTLILWGIYSSAKDWQMKSHLGLMSKKRGGACVKTLCYSREGFCVGVAEQLKLLVLTIGVCDLLIVNFVALAMALSLSQSTYY